MVVPAFSFIHYLLSTQVRLFFILKICFNSITGLGIDEKTILLEIYHVIHVHCLFLKIFLMDLYVKYIIVEFDT